ncbi:hypothetical protein LIER_33694 [Lithospermum erythrorhizon]|uniref:Prolamin-like domain-containing protein n=1 Tax=Lithospermum erythrorhizon TaxID=34254 RepID=A0AAV3S2F8_LITER
MISLKKLIVILMIATIASLNIFSAAARLGSEGFALPPLSGDVSKCWSDIRKVGGCSSEIFKFIFSGGIGSISQSCCEVINQVNSDCWPKLFPGFPQVPNIFSNKCALSPTS